MSDPNSNRMTERLRWALQALAAPAADQLRHTPAFAGQVEALAVDFDTWFGAVRSGAALSLSSGQLIALEAIDRRLARMSGREHVDLWGAPALHTSPDWAEVRQLAAAALEALGWPVEVPPPNAAVYLPGEAP